MPAKDRFHDAVRNALLKDGWTITHDPFTMTYGSRDVFVDLGASRMLAAERGVEKIAVEVKSFLGPSDIRDLEVAVGQYAFYRSLLTRIEPDRKLFLAVPDATFTGTLAESIARPVLEDMGVALFSFDPEQEVIRTWKL
jgi:hypothetical protein